MKKTKSILAWSLKASLTSKLILFCSIVLLAACSVNFVPQPTLEERQFERERVIERHLHNTYRLSDRYESLGFGPLNVIKPPVFITLDSLYDIKSSYIDNNDLRGYKLSGVDELIEDYRIYANRQKHLLKFELEHIYTTSTKDSVRLHHDYFVLDYKDSILSHTPFYYYQLANRDKDNLLNYIFELHFITDAPIFITEQELNFIRFYKEREQELIRTDELNDFMKHVMELMYIAELVNSVDFVDLAKVEAVKAVKKTFQNSEKFSFGQLLVEEDELGQVIRYMMDVTWHPAPGEEKRKTRFTFDPYLKLKEQKDLEV